MLSPKLAGQFWLQANATLGKFLENRTLYVLVLSFAFASFWTKLVFDTFLTLSVVIAQAFEVDSSYLYSEAEAAKLSVFELVVFAPVIETLMCQGLIQNVVSKYFTVLFSLIVNVMLFSVLHAVNDISNSIGAIGSGVMFFLVYEHFRQKNEKVIGLVWVALFHAFWNASLLYTIL